jgi:hypothetical protein
LPSALLASAVALSTDRPLTVAALTRRIGLAEVFFTILNG